MPSVQLQTTTEATAITHARVIERAGNRIYAFFNDGNNAVYQYSDDEGAN